MSKFFFCIFIISGFLVLSADPGTGTYPYSHILTAEEAILMETMERDFTPTDPPVGPVRQIAEFEPTYGVLIAYSGGGFGIPYNAIAEMSEVAKILTIVASTYQQNTVINLYTSYGVNLDNCEFVLAQTNTHWTRDYGPWFIIDGNNEFGVVDFPYNRPRPYDDEIPVVIADYMEMNLFGMDIEHTGGNYMCDGLGIGSSTDLVWTENPGLSHDEIDQLILDFCGIETYHVLPDPLGEYIQHIDCWGKFLDVDKVLIGEVLPSDSQYEDYEYVANYFAQQTSSYGTPYEVYRVFTPGGWSYPTPYTNSYILNNKVFVPITGNSNDSAALAVYQEAMPGYDVIGIMSGSWADTDALHCRVHEIADKNMLYVKHIPVSGDMETGTEIEILADIIAYSGEALYEDSLLVHYRVNDDDYETLIMTAVEERENSYHAWIPAQSDSCVISYYLSAADMSGRNEFHPYIGEPDPHIFNVILVNDLTDDLIASPIVEFGNYPNPFNPSGAGRSPETNIFFSLKRDSQVKLNIFNLKGKKIRTLVNQHLIASDHSFVWDGRRDDGSKVESGLYFYSLEAGSFRKTAKMVLLK